MVRIAVIGAGQMGVKIAGELAYHGHRVKIHDTSTASLDKVHGILDDDKKKLFEEGLIPQQKFVGQVLCMSKLEEAVREAEFIFEVVVEDLALKQDLFERISHCCKEDAIIASNTLRINVNEIAERVVAPERVMGIRFLFPVYYIPEVEITPGKLTSLQVIERVRKMLERMGKTLFFRSGSHPLILTETQREERKQARIEELHQTAGVGTYLDRVVPGLQHKGNFNSKEIQDEAAAVIPSDLDRDCAICMDRLRDCIFQPCHHMIACFVCGLLLKGRQDACPVCRKDIVDIIRIYHT